MKVSQSLFAAAVGCASLASVVAAPLPAHAQGGATLNIASIRPASLGWGQRGQFIVLLSENGRPIKNVTVQFWFSGRHGIKTGSWYVRTNGQGLAIFTQDIPSSWRYNDTWVDLNGAANSVGAFNLWRVKNK